MTERAQKVKNAIHVSILLLKQQREPKRQKMLYMSAFYYYNDRESPKGKKID